MRDRELKLDPPRLPEILHEPPANGKVLVLAPHADDETIGLGGTIVLHRERGDPVDVLYLTAGTTGDAEGRYDAGEYTRLRQEEARAACRVLGVEKVHFWEYPDNYQVTEADMALLVPRLRQILDQGAYDAVYTPHRLEVHSDHHVCAVVAARALKEMPKAPSLIAYEIWAPLAAADVVVDVTRVYEKKREAARCYQTQLALRNFIRLFECLDGYRSVVLEEGALFGEAFTRLWSRP